MPSAVVCPDKFRGSLSAPEAASALAAGLARAGFDDVREIPLADGGEGTLDALLARGGARRRTRVTGPLGEPLEAVWGVLADGTAVIEMAQASGLALLDGPNDALRATTRGTGELIAEAIGRGSRRVVVGVGGSATTDGGLGALTALGWSLRGVEVTVACDVTIGFVDAAVVFAPQKGATPAQVALLTRRLERLADEYLDRTGVDVRPLTGSGAAGGLAGGLAAIGAALEEGFEVVSETVGLADALDGVDMVVTGEGSVDAPSLQGKVVGGVLDLAADLGVGARAVVCGTCDPGTGEEIAVAHGRPPLALLDRAWDADDSRTRAALLAEEAALEVGTAVLAGR